jgi:hypothetical protein
MVLNEEGIALKDLFTDETIKEIKFWLFDYL